MADNDPTMTERDEQFRREMRERQDPQAQAWVAKDNAALELQDQVDRGTREVDRRQGAAVELHRALEDARQEREDFRADNPRPGMFSGERKGWDAEYGRLDQHASEVQQEWQEALRKSSPEELKAMGDRIKEDREQLAKTIAERQGIALMPSEEAGQEDLHAQVSSAGMANMAARRQQQDQGQEEGEGQGEGRGQGGGMRLRPRYGAYATTLEEDRQNKQLEEDQRELGYRLGRRATDDELQAYERERQEHQQQEQGQVQRPPEQEDLHAQVAGVATPESILARRAQRQGQTQEQDAPHQAQEPTQQSQRPQEQDDLHTQVSNAGMANMAARREQQVRGTSTFAEREQAAQATAKQEATSQSAAAPTQERKREDSQGQGMGM